ncbi:MAG: FAD-dependent monooxygenase [Acetobacteraceae bacterium]|nr:MAG: FAD-dependent monooxygenase [Acetobacteraceae bacterium]
MKARRILVAGAGPVGLVAAAALAEEGIPVTIVEAEQELPDDLRASTFHPPTLDMLDRFGVVQPMLAMGMACPTWEFRDRASGPVACFDLGLLKDDTRHPYRLQCEQWRLTRLLRDRLAARGDVEFIYDARATDLWQDADTIHLTVSRTDGSTERLTGAFLIGADGARSAVRKAAGIGFEEMTVPETYLTLSTPFAFHAAIPQLANVAYVSDPEEWFVLVRTRLLWRLLLPTNPAEPEERMMSESRLQERMQRVLPTGTAYELRHRTAYRVHERVAQRYVAGRVVLVGDAAHVNNPLGGMGMNGGIHDAINLADKLAAVWRGEPMALLGRYERQRRKVALDVVQAQAMRNRQMLSQRDPAARSAYHDSLRSVAQDPVKHREHLLQTSLIQSLRDLEAVA